VNALSRHSGATHQRTRRENISRQRATCTAQALGILDKTHDAMFDAVCKTGELAISDPKTHVFRNPLGLNASARPYRFGM
jgi:hypothetical protein